MSDAHGNHAEERPAAVALCVQLSRTYSEAVRRIDGKLSNVHGLSFGDFTILYHLKHAHESRLRRTDLAELIGVTASAVTRSLIPLEKIGVVDRQSDARDARVGYACLTAAGHELFASACVTAETACQDAIRGVPASLVPLLSQAAGRIDNP
ncbi:MarR family winged helix-turn-helix transcriptional regulator [Burkholderia ubonensis]|uniref:MarR family transcriptional regulator n=1 Tax=Burkholderia ubonensis subsp. mesacidophila TaxID=265293 RepID=A0A2A4FDW1_9BURK|nr:MarR family winged helix-turn-helix transcriptional regulator [Burkholderia ubonensis]PCE30606.1 MarR family transcriptional regulator [Burkholderia ubonensis subsp. mesacidophila]